MDADLTGPGADQLLEMLRLHGLTDLVRLASPWMGPEETAAYLGIALGTLRNWTSARFIPFAKRGRIVRYHRHAIDKWLNNGSCPGRAHLADM